MTKKRKSRPWTSKQERDLFNGVSISGLDWFRRHCGKSTKAIYSKVAREYGPGGLTRGAYTLRGLSRSTGYSSTQLWRAQEALGQKWKRLGPHGAHLITEEQRGELVTWLGHDYWAKRQRRYTCEWCATSNRPPEALGLCVRCYHRHRRLCLKLGLPVTLVGQLVLCRRVANGASDRDSQSGRIVREGLLRLERGLSLTETQIDCLSLLR